MNRLAQTLAIGAIFMCPPDLDAGAPEVGMPPHPDPVAVYTDVANTAREIRAIINRIRDTYGVDQ